MMIYPNHVTDRIRRMIIASMEDPYTFDQLKEPRLNVLVVKPLVDLLYDEDDVSVGMLYVVSFFTLEWFF